DDDASAVFDTTPHDAAVRHHAVGVGEWREGARHRDHNRVHHAFHRLIVEYGKAAHLIAARRGAHVEFLQTLRAGDDEEVRLERAVCGATAGRPALLL